MDNNPLSVSIARHPVFDDKRRLWGYELFCVGQTASLRSGDTEETNVAISVESSAYVCLQQVTESGKKIIVDFTEKNILENLPYALPPLLAAVKVSEHVCRKPSVMDVLRALKADGYLIAVEGFSGEPNYAPLYQLADVIGMDVSKMRKEDLDTAVAPAAEYKAMLLALLVQSQTQFKLCQESGFHLFHGPFFKSPDQITIRKLSSNEALRFKLLQMMEEEEPNVALFAKTLKADATISLRLLAYLNSAAFHLTQKVKSIQQAIALLGWRNAKNWLRVILMADMSQNKAAHELVLLSAQRGMFLELVARDHDFWGFDPESMHLLGIFSLLDALLSVPMTEVVTNLPLDQKMKEALCREPNNEYLPLLRLAQCLEEARWSDSEGMIRQLNLDGEKVRTAFKTSVTWAIELEVNSAHP